MLYKNYRKKKVIKQKKKKLIYSQKVSKYVALNIKYIKVELKS